MTCQEVMEYMQRQLDGDLDEFETEILMKHTRHCPDCSAMFERLKTLSTELEGLPKVTPSYSLVDSILPELERIDLLASGEVMEQTSTNSVGYSPRGRVRKRWTQRMSFRALSGVIAAGVVVGIFLVTYHPDSLKDASNSLAFESSAADSGTDAGSDDSAAADAPMSKKSAAALNAPKSTSDNSPDDDSAADKAAAANQPTDGTKAPADAVVPKLDGGNAAADSADSSPLKAGSPQQPSSSSETRDNASAQVPKEPDGIAKGQIFGAATEGPNAKPDTFRSNDQAGGEKRYTAVPNKNGSLSPNGAYNAAVSDTKITIYDAAAGGVLYEKEKNGAVRIIAWSKDSSTLEYAVQAADGSEKRFVIDVSKGTEMQQQ